MSNSLGNIRITLSQSFMPKSIKKQSGFFNVNNLNEENNFYSLLKKKRRRFNSNIKNNNEVYKCPCCSSKLLSKFYRHIHDFSKENNSKNSKQEINQLKYQLSVEKVKIPPKKNLYPTISNQIIESSIKLKKEDAHINEFNDYQQIDFNNEIGKNEEINFDNNKIIGIKEENFRDIQENYINFNEQKNNEDTINENFREQDKVSENENEDRTTEKKHKKHRLKKWKYLKVEKMIPA